jgi:hypothetical protein
MLRNEEIFIPNATYASERNTASSMKTFFDLVEYVLTAHEFVISVEWDHKNMICRCYRSWIMS